MTEIRELGIRSWVEGGVELILVMPKALLVEYISKIYVLYKINHVNLYVYLASKQEPEPPFPFSGRGRGPRLQPDRGKGSVAAMWFELVEN
jgi:hypothetical protein